MARWLGDYWPCSVSRTVITVLCSRIGSAPNDNRVRSDPGVMIVYLVSVSPSRARRIAWSLRHPLRSRQFPARNERLITADELRLCGW
jgi:hypothetical protein